MKSASFSLFATQIIVSPTPRSINHRRWSPCSITCPLLATSTFSLKLKSRHSPRHPSFVSFSGSDVGGGGGGSRGSGGGGGRGSDADSGERNKAEAIMALVEVGRSLDSIPNDLEAAIEAGKVPGSIVHRFFELEKSPLLGWLLRFGGFKERLLADDLFLTKVAIECGVGIGSLLRLLQSWKGVEKSLPRSWISSLLMW